MSNISVNKTEFNLMGDNLLQAQNLASTLYTTSKRWGDSIINASVKPNFYQNYLKKNNSNTVSKCINEINATLKLIADLTQNLHDEYINIKGSIDLYESKSLAFNTAMVGNLAYTAGETYKYKTQLTAVAADAGSEGVSKGTITLPPNGKDYSGTAIAAQIRSGPAQSNQSYGVASKGTSFTYFGTILNNTGPLTAVSGKSISDYGSNYTRWDLVRIKDEKGNEYLAYVSGNYTGLSDDNRTWLSKQYQTGLISSVIQNPENNKPSSSGNDATGKENVVYKATVTASSLNMRTGPGTENEKITSIPNGATVEVIQEDKDGWTQIRYANKIGYVSSKYLEKELDLTKIVLKNEPTNKEILLIENSEVYGQISNKIFDKDGKEIILTGTENVKIIGKATPDANETWYVIQRENDSSEYKVEIENLTQIGAITGSGKYYVRGTIRNDKLNEGGDLSTLNIDGGIVKIINTFKDNQNNTWVKIETGGKEYFVLEKNISYKISSFSSEGSSETEDTSAEESAGSEETTTDDTASGESSSGSGSGDVGSSAGDSSTAITDTNTSGSAGSTDSNTTVPSGDSNSSSSGNDSYNDSTSGTGSAGGTTDNATGNENTGGTTGGVVPGAGNTSNDSYYNDGTSSGGNNSSVESEEDYPTITFIHTGPDEYKIDIINKDEIANNSGAAGGSSSGGSIDSTPDTPSTPDIGDGSTTIFPDEDTDDAIVPGEGDLGGEITTEGEHTFETIEPEITNPALDEGLYVPESETIITEPETDGIVDTPVGSTYSESVIEPNGVSAPAEIISGISGTTTFSSTPSASNSATKYSFSSIEDNSFTSVASKTTLGESMATVSMASKADLMPTTSNIASSMPDNIADASTLNTVSAAGAALGIGSVTSKIFNRVDEAEKQVKEENAIGEKFLPVGTIVSVKEVSKKIMIIGFCAMSKEDSAKVYDYIGCFYPEGYMAADKTCMFDHNQIDRVVKLGYVDNEENTFKEKLNKLINSIGTNK